MKGTIQVRDLKKSYGSHIVLREQEKQQPLNVSKG